MTDLRGKYPYAAMLDARNKMKCKTRRRELLLGRITLLTFMMGFGLFCIYIYLVTF